jgi:hypothetical protein
VGEHAGEHTAREPTQHTAVESSRRHAPKRRGGLHASRIVSQRYDEDERLGLLPRTLGHEVDARQYSVRRRRRRRRPRLDGPVSFERAARTGHSRLLFTAATRQVQPDQEANSTAYRNRILRNIAAHSGDRAAAGVIGSPPLSRSATALDSEYFDRSVIGKGTEHRHAAAARAEAMASYAVLRNVSAQPNIPRSAQQTIMATQAATTAALSA